MGRYTQKRARQVFGKGVHVRTKHGDGIVRGNYMGGYDACAKRKRVREVSVLVDFPFARGSRTAQYCYANEMQVV